MVTRKDGTLTANAEEINDMLHEVWGPIFQMYAQDSHPEWETLSQRFGGYVAACPMRIQKLTGTHLRRTLGCMREGSAFAGGGRAPPFALGLARQVGEISGTG